jgi:hypothetical protein
MSFLRTLSLIVPGSVVLLAGAPGVPRSAAAAPPPAATAACVRVADDAQVPLTLPRRATLGDLLKLAARLTCQPYRAAPAIARRPLLLVSPPTVSGKQVAMLVPQAVRLLGLKVDWKDGAREVVEPAAAGVPAKLAAVGADAASGVTAVDATHYTIDRGIVGQFFTDQATFFRAVRIVPHVENGVAAGFRIFGVSPGSFTAAIGLKNGDTVYRINGFDLTSPDQALAAYARLRTAATLTVELFRRGAPLTLEYRISP